MSERVRFFKSGALLTVVALTMRTVIMLFGAFISRTVGAEGTGLYTVVMTVYSFAVTFATSGVSLTVTRLVASAIGEGRPDRVRGVMKAAFLYSVTFGAVATAALFLGADLIGNMALGDPRTVSSLRVLAFSLIPCALGAVVSGYFVGVRRIGFNAVTQVMMQLLKISVTVMLVVKMAPEGIESAVVALCIGMTVTEVLGFVLQLAELIWDSRRSGYVGKGSEELSFVTKTAIPLALSAYVRSAFLTLEHILIPKRLKDGGESDSEAYSHYGTLHGMALPVILYPMTPLSSFSGLLVPEFAAESAAHRQDRINRIASEAMNTTLAYATVCAVILFAFSNELGYAVYDSYEAGYYISMLSLVVPIMYLDHVTDSMLKGIGEQVFSMWVNITDSILSIVLVWILIPKLGILGYAIVIVIMEAYNFALSLWRLGSKVRFSLSPIKCFLMPLVSSLAASHLSDKLFCFGGSSTPAVWIALKILFTVCAVVFAYQILGFALNYILVKCRKPENA